MKKGFTLIETLVAVFILTLGIIATSTVTQRNLQGAFYARDQIVAYFLAEEAVEMIRNMRDTNLARGGDWLYSNEPAAPNHIPAPAQNNDSQDDLCVDTYVDVINEGLPYFVDCPSDGLLSYHPETEGYHYHSVGNGWVKSRYSREITLTRRSESEIEIQVTVRWSNSLASNKSFTIHKSLLKR